MIFKILSNCDILEIVEGLVRLKSESQYVGVYYRNRYLGYLDNFSVSYNNMDNMLLVINANEQKLEFATNDQYIQFMENDGDLYIYSFKEKMGLISWREKLAIKKLDFTNITWEQLPKELQEHLLKSSKIIGFLTGAFLEKSQKCVIEFDYINWAIDGYLEVTETGKNVTIEKEAVIYKWN